MAVSCSCKECANLCSHTEMGARMEVSYGHHGKPCVQRAARGSGSLWQAFPQGEKKAQLQNVFFLLEMKWRLRK